MKRNSLLLLIMLLAAGTSVAQRNRIKPIGLVWDQPVQREASSLYFFPLGLQAGYERSFGTKMSLGLNAFYHFVPKDDYPFSNDRNVTNGNTTTYYSGGAMIEGAKFGFSYEPKFFFDSFDEEPEGLFLSANLAYYFMEQTQNEGTVYEVTGSNIGPTVTIPSSTNTYNMWRYGLKLGIQYNGELYAGYYLNIPGNGRLETEKEVGGDRLKTEGNFVIGYIWGFNF